MIIEKKCTITMNNSKLPYKASCQLFPEGSTDIYYQIRVQTSKLWSDKQKKYHWGIN